jgi:5'-nucleotidase
MNRLKALLLGAVSASCYLVRGEPTDIDGKDVVVTFLHTSDWHARILPYFEALNVTDQTLGLSQGSSPFGGAPRMKTIVDQQKALSERPLFLDSGDCFQGAPIFNVYSGAAEYDAMSSMGVDVQVIGNHEFDRGGVNWANQARLHASYPLLAANYAFTDGSPLNGIAQPYAIFNLKGLKVGVIGMGNKSSITSIFDQGNGLGIVPLGDLGTAQFYADFLRPQVNLILIVSHMGLEDDILMAKRVRGVDAIFGGHNHIVVRPPLQIESEVSPGEKVLIIHSGAFMKYVGRVDAVVRQNKPNDPNDWDIISNSFQLFPVDTRVEEDPTMLNVLRPYVFGLQQQVELTQPVAYAPKEISRFSLSGGDSALGNVVAASMLAPVQVRAQFALTNSTGIRAQIAPGPVTVEQLFNIFPFDNLITTMTLSGREVQELMDFVARRSASRGCQTQAQVAGIDFTNDCRQTRCLPPNADGEKLCEDKGRRICVEDFDCRASAENITIGGEPLVDDLSYGIAVNDFIAQGGSGFVVLARNTTKVNTDLSLRDGVQNFFGAFPRLGEFAACNTINTADPNVCGEPAAGSLAERCCELTVCYGNADGETTDILRQCTGELSTQKLALCSAFEEGSAERTDCEDLAELQAEVECRSLPCVAGSAAEEDARITRILP